MSTPTPAASTASASARRRRAPFLALAAVHALHLALLLYFAPPHVMLAREPLYDIDYPLHYHQVDRARRAFADSGRLWGYDPTVLAGHPAGALEDISSKTIELFVIGLDRLGVHPATAFNLYVLLIHLLLPLVGYAAARLLSLGRWQAVTAAGLWVLLWYLDSFMHWLWFCGMISWAGASYLTVLLVALLYRALQGRPRLLRWAAVAALTGLLALWHPFAALTLAAPCGALYIRQLRRARPGVHLGIAASAAAAAGAAMVWLLPALRMRHYMLHEETFLRPTLDYLLYDFLDVMKDDWQTGPPVRTMIRVLCFAAGAVTLWRWRRAGDGRALPLALLVTVGLLFAYVGGHVGAMRMTQPYRQLGPAMLAAAIPAAVLLTELLHPAALAATSRPARLLLVLAALLIVPRLARTALYYLPQLLPDDRSLAADIARSQVRPSPLVGISEPRPISLRHHRPPAAAREVRSWLQEHLKGRGRVLVQEYMLAEYLAATSELPILGGLVQRALHHADAHMFRVAPDGVLPDEALTRYLRRYNVRYVVMTKIIKPLEWRKDALEFVTFIGPVRIYETTIEPSYFMRGRGRVVEQRMNHLRVVDAAGDPLVLRFHWMETLRCRPGCRVERQPVQGDRVGFIRVPDPPPAFEIYQSY